MTNFVFMDIKQENQRHGRGVVPCHIQSRKRFFFFSFFLFNCLVNDQSQNQRIKKKKLKTNKKKSGNFLDDNFALHLPLRWKTCLVDDHLAWMPNFNQSKKNGK